MAGSLMNLWPQLPPLECGRSAVHAPRGAHRMEMTQAQGLAPGGYFTLATSPSLLATNRAVTNPLNRKIQRNMETPGCWRQGHWMTRAKPRPKQVLPAGPTATPRPRPLCHPTNDQVAARLGSRGRAPRLPFLPALQAHLPGFWPVGWLPSGGREHPGGLTGRREDGQVDGWWDGITQHSSVLSAAQCIMTLASAAVPRQVTS